MLNYKKCVTKLNQIAQLKVEENYRQAIKYYRELQTGCITTIKEIIAQAEKSQFIPLNLVHGYIFDEEGWFSQIQDQHTIQSPKIFQLIKQLFRLKDRKKEQRFWSRLHLAWSQLSLWQDLLEINHRDKKLLIKKTQTNLNKSLTIMAQLIKSQNR